MTGRLVYSVLGVIGRDGAWRETEKEVIYREWARTTERTGLKSDK